jgi:hypothetical protein
VSVNWGYDITNFIFETSGLFTEIVFLDVLECGIRAEYIEAPIARKFPRKNSRELTPPPLSSSNRPFGDTNRALRQNRMNCQAAPNCVGEMALLLAGRDWLFVHTREVPKAAN